MKALRVVTMLFVVLLAAGLGSGCVPQTVRNTPDADLVKANHKAAEALIDNLHTPLDQRLNIIVATLVNVDSLESSSAFGRIASEQLSSRLTQLGYSVVEMKLRDNVFIKQQAGEFILSRELRNISLGHNAQAVVTGTYAVGQDQVYVAVRIIDPGNSVILAAHDYTLPIGKNTRTLLRP